MIKDLGSRDGGFISVVKNVCNGILNVADLKYNQFTAIPIQGSGTFGVEAAISSNIRGNQKNNNNHNQPQAVIDHNQKHNKDINKIEESASDKGLLILVNGAYGSRMVEIAKRHNLPHHVFTCPDNQHFSLPLIDKYLSEHNKNISHVSVVHSETTSGIINDIEAIGSIVNKYSKTFIVDSMSGFGAIPINFQTSYIDFLVSSSNKCLEGVPGFSFVIARRSALEKCKGKADSLSLDIFDQSTVLESSGQFRFTPPVHSFLAFEEALKEFKMEGGVLGRSKRYKENQSILQAGMDKLGFKLYLEPEKQGYIISSYLCPTDKNWSFDHFYQRLNELGFVIYPGKVSGGSCFRIGHIGRIFPNDTHALLSAIKIVCEEMKTASFFPHT